MMLRYWIYFRIVFLSYLPLMLSVVFIVSWNPVGEIDRFIAGMTIPAAVATSYVLFFSGWIGGVDRWMTSQILKADEFSRRKHPVRRNWKGGRRNDG